MPYAVLMPIFADQILHRGANGLGILMGATGVGALLGALSLAMRSGLRGVGRQIGISALGFGIFLIAFSWARTFWLSAAAPRAGRILHDVANDIVEYIDSGHGS